MILPCVFIGSQVYTFAYSLDITISDVCPVSSNRHGKDRRQLWIPLRPRKDKSNVVLEKYHPDPKLVLNDLPIQLVNSFTYLGVVIDKGLRFHKHAQYLVDRATNVGNAIRVLASRFGVNLSILRRISNATVRPILDYGSEVFCLMSISSINSLQTAQNTAIKKFLGVANWTATDNVHKELNVLPVANRSEMAKAKLEHNIIQNITHPLQQYIDSELHPT